MAQRPLTCLIAVSRPTKRPVSIPRWNHHSVYTICVVPKFSSIGSTTVRSASRDDKIKIWAAHATEFAKHRSSKSTCGQQAVRDGSGQDKEPLTGTNGRLKRRKEARVVSANSPSISITILDGRASFKCTGHTDDGGDDTLLSPRLQNPRFTKGNREADRHQPMRLQVALCKGESAAWRTISRTWKAPRTVLPLATGQLPLVTMSNLVNEDDHVCEKMLLGLPVLHHLPVDTNTLLESNCAALIGTYRSFVGIPSIQDPSGRVSSMMTACFN